MSMRQLAAGAAFLLAAGAATLVLALGDGDGEPAPGGAAGAQPSRLLEPAQFAAQVAKPGVVTVNVHVPDEGSIRGTDLALPFDRIEALRAELPPPSAPLAVYCRSGRMSAIAVRALARLGYARVSELAGGMDAWAASGRPLLPPA